MSTISTKSAAARKARASVARTAAPRPAAKRPLATPTAPAAKAKPARAKAPAGARKIAQPRRAAATRVAAAAPPRQSEPRKKNSPALAGVLGGAGRVLGALASGKALVIGIALVLVLVVGGIFVVNSPLFGATAIVVNGSEHVSRETAERLLEVPGGTTLLNVNTSALAESLMGNPWISGVDVEREFPHTLVITPHERSVAAIVYITTDDVAWAIGDDGCWIAPVSLAVTVDAEGNVVDEAASVPESSEGATDGDAAAGDASTDGSDGAASADAGDAAGDDAAAKDGSDALPDGSQRLSGLDAARVLAHQDGAVLFTDVPADVAPSSGMESNSEIVQAGLAYANGFSDALIAQIDHIALPSVDAITAYLTSGVEVALGAPDDIEDKELIVTRLLEQQQGVTYVNVRTPDAYTFRSAPTS